MQFLKKHIHSARKHILENNIIFLPRTGFNNPNATKAYFVLKRWALACYFSYLYLKYNSLVLFRDVQLMRLMVFRKSRSQIYGHHHHNMRIHLAFDATTTSSYKTTIKRWNDVFDGHFATDPLRLHKTQPILPCLYVGWGSGNILQVCVFGTTCCSWQLIFDVGRIASWRMQLLTGGCWCAWRKPSKWCAAGRQWEHICWWAPHLVGYNIVCKERTLCVLCAVIIYK